MGRLATALILQEAEACRIFHLIVNGVADCHDKGMSHKDLKPDNVLVTDVEATRLKIIDWGLAQRGEMGISRGGAVLFMAPEVLGVCARACGWLRAHPFHANCRFQILRALTLVLPPLLPPATT